MQEKGEVITEMTRNQTNEHGMGLLDDVEYWRGRAEETRVLAESMDDVASKRIMLGIAADCERIAQRAEQRAKRRCGKSN